ncbi:MAG: indole-3-glycerol phosphate synthase TrpC [Puniceicoccaceae bacterium]
MPTSLEEIIAQKHLELKPRLRRVRDEELARFASFPRISFRRAISASAPGIIGEIKRRSPSAGAICDDADPVEYARNYVNAGIDAISVLTDQTFFGGDIQDLCEVTDFLRHHQRAVPVLRKDFTVHPLQILEAAEAGASAILLIAAALNRDTLLELYRCAELAGLDAIFEVHNQTELDLVLSCEPRIVGVNNRNLHTFSVDLSTSEALIPLIPDDIVSIAESGIFTDSDLQRVAASGARAILVGEALMRSPDPEAWTSTARECWSLSA